MSDKPLFHFPHGAPVIAHRGASALAPENTVASFRRAMEDGAVWIESDVKLTYDGVPILMHDDTLDRTTDGHGNVADTKWAELQKLDAGSWFDAKFKGEPVPHLHELLYLVIDHKLRLNLELKPCPGRAKATVMVALIELTKIWPENMPPPLVSSFDIDALTVAASLHPECPRGLLLEGWQDDWAASVHLTEANTIHIDQKALNKDRVATLREARLPVIAYTVNEPVRAKELLQWGVAAVFSDNPKEIISAL